MPSDRVPVGLVLGSQIPPEQIPPTAKLGEELGFAELWLAEDYFFTGGISGAAAALALTKEIPVGLGIVSAMVRHPALLAMEISTIARMFPGRIWPGIGLGLPPWVKQMGLYPKSQLGALRECVSSLRRLLDGEELTERGEYYSFDAIRLAYPLERRVPIYMGVLGPKMLRLAGEIADGTVSSVLTSVEYVRWAREQIAAGQQAAGRTDHHRFPAFAMFSVDHDSQRAKAALRPAFAFTLSLMPHSPLGDAYGITGELVGLAAGGAEGLEREMPERWLTDLNVVGDPDECAHQIRRLLEAGADSVILFPSPVERAEEIVRLAAAEVLPRL